MIRRLVMLGVAALLPLVAPGLSPAPSASGSFEALVQDERNKPIADAVVSLVPASPVPPGRPTPAVMDQQNKEYVPHVLPVVVGSSVAFPNRDNIRHHVYSFSSPKRFELPLYIGTPAAPVLFDKPGVVVLGCNIHDWMVGYIYVLTTPYFARSAEDGRARLADVPAGVYEARVWHPRMKGDTDKSGKPVTITTGGEPGSVSFVVALKADQRRQPPAPQYDTRPQS
jgi:plastocyanin